MKKALSIALICLLSLSVLLCACSGASGGEEAPDNVIESVQTPVPVVELPQQSIVTAPSEDYSLDNMMADFATKIQAGSAGSSLKAVAQAARLMSWGVNTTMSEEEIYTVVSVYLSELDDAALGEYMMQLQLLDESYKTLLQPGQEELLATAGCADAPYPWSAGPIPAVEMFMSAAGLREVYNASSGTNSAEGAYAVYVDDMFTALGEGWSLEMAQQRQLNTMLMADFMAMDWANELGWCMHDVNGDGVGELIIGSVTDPTAVYDIVSYSQGQLQKVFEGWVRNRAGITPEGIVAVRGSGGAGYTTYTFYTVEDYKLSVFGAVVYDADSSPEAPWFISYDDDGDISNDSPASQQQAQSLIAQYESRFISFPFTPFMPTEQ